MKDNLENLWNRIEDLTYSEKEVILARLEEELYSNKDTYMNKSKIENKDE